MSRSKKKNIDIISIAPAFYVILFAFAIVGLGYMMMLGIPTNNLGLIAMSLIFGFLFLSGLLFSQNVLNRSKEPFEASAQGFVIGFIAWYAISSLKFLSSAFSIFSFPLQATLSTVSEEIPPFWKIINVVVMSPIVEELFWGLALPLVSFSVMDELGKKQFPALRNNILQFIIVILLGGLTFAVFHTSTTQFGFFIAAMLFRTIQTMLYFGDKQFDFVPKYTVPYSFLIGTHMANNLSEVGVGNVYEILLSNMFGWVTMIIFVTIFIIGIRGFLNGKRQRK